MNLYDCKILLIDDNAELVSMISGILTKSGFESIYTAGSCSSGLEVFLKEEPQLVILDIMLPDGDGFTLFRRLREQSQVPILFLSARDEDNDRLFGLGLGADDYIEKPVDPQILAAKIRAVLQRTSDLHRKETISCCGVVIERAQHRAFVDGNLMELNAKEFELLTLLVSNAGKTLRKEYIFASIWGMDSFSEQQTLTVHIKMLRDKIEKNPKQPQRIKTVWGVGYRFEEV